MSENEIKIPRHLAFIMDGNGRWAQKRGMPREYGHSVGAKVFKTVSTYCQDRGVEYVTTYALSTENLKNRSRHELNAIFLLLREYIKDALVTAPKRNTRVKFPGDRSVFSPELIQMMGEVEEKTSGYKYLLNIAVNYGGRDEIVRAVNRLIADGYKSVTEEDITSALDTGNCPPPDMIIRTGCELRLSNFMLWQAAYSEFYFTDILWPDFGEKDVDAAIKEYSRRQRRFGSA